MKISNQLLNMMNIPKTLLTPLAFAALLVFSSCSPRGTSGFTSVSEGGFSPETTFKELGYTVKHGSNQGVSNPAYLYRWHQLQGELTVPDTTNACETVAVAIRDALNKSLGEGMCHDELTSPAIPNPIGKAGQLLYNKNGMQGHVHVWLFGAPSDSKVQYAILLREERERK